MGKGEIGNKEDRATGEAGSKRKAKAPFLQPPSLPFRQLCAAAAFFDKHFQVVGWRRIGLARICPHPHLNFPISSLFFVLHSIHPLFCSFRPPIPRPFLFVLPTMIASSSSTYLRFFPNFLPPNSCLIFFFVFTKMALPLFGFFAPFLFPKYSGPLDRYGRRRIGQNTHTRRGEQ